MSFDIFSVDFFKQIAKAKADINKDGIINDNEYELNGKRINEKSLFNIEYKKFDINNDGVIDEQDTSLYRESVTLTDGENIKIAKQKEFREKHPNFDVNTATAEDLNEYINLMSHNKLIIKEINRCEFCQDITNTVEYLLNFEVSELNNYWHSISKMIGIDNSKDKNIENVRKDMKSLNLYSISLTMKFNDVKDAQKLANTLSAEIINTADKAPDDIYVQRDAIKSLWCLSFSTKIDNKAFIDDVKTNLKTIQAKFEQDLKDAIDDNERQSINETIASIDKLINKY